MLAEQIGQRTALAVDNARLLIETQARAEREAVVNAIGHALRASLDADEILQIAVREVGQALGVSRCLWCWVDTAREILTIAPQQFMSPGVARRQGSFAFDAIPEGLLTQWVGADPVIVNDLAGHPLVNEYRSQMPKNGDIAAFVACPIVLRGERNGLFVVQQTETPREWKAAEVALLRQVCDLLAPALENAQLYAREHRVADMLQAAFLSNIPDTLSELELATIYRAGLDESQVGGDCYDVFPLPDGRVGLVIADVSGKGLSAAVLTATVKFSLRAFAAEVSAPSLVITRLNRTLCSEATGMGEHFVTLFYAVFDPANGRLTYASAGHETQLIKRAQGTTLLHATGPILGIAEHHFDQQEEHLNRGDTLILYTDGLTEARNPETRELLDVNRVSAHAENLPTLLGAGGLSASLERLALDWAHGRPHDDMALLVARRALLEETIPPPQRVTRTENHSALGDCLFRFSFPSEANHAADVRQAVRHWMETLKFPRATIDDFLTAVTEAVTNAVRHGAPQGKQDQFQVAAFRAENHAILVEVIDCGPGLADRNTAPPMPDPEAINGRGMPLMREFADAVEYIPNETGLCVRLVKHRTK